MHFQLWPLGPLHLSFRGLKDRTLIFRGFTLVAVSLQLIRIIPSMLSKTCTPVYVYLDIRIICQIVITLSVTPGRS
jgi:hypothetical protein